MSARAPNLLISDVPSPNIKPFCHGDATYSPRHPLALGVLGNIGPNPFRIEYWVLTTPLQVPASVYQPKSPKIEISARKSDFW